MNVKLIKTSAGEWIIGDVESRISDSESVIVNNPHILVSNQQGKGMIVPYAPFAKCEQLTFDAGSVMHVLDPVDDLAASYRQLVTGIVVPSQTTFRETLQRG